jgi:hypothetical protein
MISIGAGVRAPQLTVRDRSQYQDTDDTGCLTRTLADHEPARCRRERTVLVERWLVIAWSAQLPCHEGPGTPASRAGQENARGPRHWWGPRPARACQLPFTSISRVSWMLPNLPWMKLSRGLLLYGMYLRRHMPHAWRHCTSFLRLPVMGTLKRYSKALEYEYRVKTVVPGTLKRYSIFFSLYI